MPSPIEWIEYIQSWRSPHMDAFFRFWNFFDTPYFFLALLPAIWFGGSRRIALQLYFIFFVEFLSIQILKNFFAHPRPCSIQPSLGLVPVTGYSFPSGGATTAFLLAALLLIYTKKKYIWLLAFVFFFFLSFSRMYLGVHFPIDILGGWGLGACLFLLFWQIFPLLRRLLSPYSRPVRAAIAITILGIGSHFLQAAFFTFAGIGLVLGWLYTKPQPDTPRASLRLLRALYGVIAVFSCFFLLSSLFFLPAFVKNVCLGWGTVVLGNVLCRHAAP